MGDGPGFKRVILKLSGEALKGERDYGIDPAVVRGLAEELEEVAALGIELGIVVGGGNIFRGISAEGTGINRTVADHIGMLATMMNSLSLQSALENIGVGTRVMSAIQMNDVAEPYIRRRAMAHLAKGLIVIFACGTGNPYFSTDTAGALRASEVEAEVLLKGTKVEGIYSEDPVANPKAEFIRHISYKDFLTRDLRVMDASAIALCRENRLPVIVFNMSVGGNILRAVRGEKIGTLIGGGNDAGQD
jgi:uridylate kinase